ncbi:hypothetical protein GOV11_02600 [Candidatus Woesearchaeota archaeon]|nr:hypothetical protein [Candidatus Woesearchaeota archaeon]
MAIDTQLKEWGNSYGIRISKKTAQKLNLKRGDSLSVDIVRKGRTFTGFGICKNATAFRRDHDDRF